VSLATEYDWWHTNVFESDPQHQDESTPGYQLLLEFLIHVHGKKLAVRRLRNPFAFHYFVGAQKRNAR
jgi:hypothetical protein